MSADPGGLFRCLMVQAEGEKENMLIAQRKDTLYLGYGRDYRSVDLQGVPVEHIALEEPKAYQKHAVFYHRPSHISDLNGRTHCGLCRSDKPVFRWNRWSFYAMSSSDSFRKTASRTIRFSCSITATRCGLTRQLLLALRTR